MQTVVVIISIGFIIFLAIKFMPTSISSSIGGGASLSVINDQIKINGNILSVTHNGTILKGDPSLPKNNSNSISQSHNDCSIKISGGHVVIKGPCSKLVVNNQRLV